MANEDDTVVIPKSEYERLLKDSAELGVLHAFGVDNWSGYEEAQELLNNEEG